MCHWKCSDQNEKSIVVTNLRLFGKPTKKSRSYVTRGRFNYLIDYASLWKCNITEYWKKL